MCDTQKNSIQLAACEYKRSRSSKSDNSNMNCANLATANDRIPSDCGVGTNSLLEEYGNVFSIMADLNKAIASLTVKVNEIVGVSKQGDTVHSRLFTMLADKMKSVSKMVNNSGLTQNKKLNKQNKKEVTSVFSSKELQSSNSTANDVKTSLTSLIIPGKEIIPSIAVVSAAPAKKRRISLPIQSDQRLQTSSPVVDFLSPQLKPSLTVPSVVSSGSGSSKKLQNELCEKKFNYFDVIASLNKINFIDHEQVIILKKCVIKREEYVLLCLREYERNKDLQVLANKFGAIIESC